MTDTLHVARFDKGAFNSQLPSAFHQGQFVRMMGRLYMVHHIVNPETLAVYCVDDFGPYGSQVWIASGDVDEPR